MRTVLKALVTVEVNGQLEEIIKQTGFGEEEVLELLLCSAISALQLYVVDNFLCFVDEAASSDTNDPATTTTTASSFDEVYHFVESLFAPDGEDSEQMYSLISDGEAMHSVGKCFDFFWGSFSNIPISKLSARHTDFLKLARYLLTFLLKHHDHSTKVNSSDVVHQQLHLFVWCLRAVAVHQSSLKAATSSLYEETRTLVERILTVIETADQQMNAQLKLHLLTELTSAVLLFGEAEASKRLFGLAEAASRLQFNLTGALGTRTLFQNKPVSQLLVAVKKAENQSEGSEGEEEGEEEVAQPAVNLPKNEKLEDDTLLQDVKFVSSSSSSSSAPSKLTPSEQCFLLAAIKFSRRFGASGDALLTEQLLAYVYHLLERSTVWSVSFSLLELRSLLERGSRRRVERSMKQIETLAKTVRHEQLSVAYERRFLFGEALARTGHFYAVLPSPHWTVEKHLADLLLSLGVLRAALDTYLRLEAWTEVITCYRQLGRPDKAEEIVRRKLAEVEAAAAEGDTPSNSKQKQAELHCLLGEITGDLEYYHTAWRLSGERYARPPKMLGLHYFELKEYQTALGYLKQSVAVNSMQVDAWYRIGFISLQQEQWEAAATAYRQVLQFEAEEGSGFEAWNNLSKAYIKLGEKARAMRTLQEAIRLNFEEWKLWDNYIAVAADVGAFGEVLEAWGRLIDLKGGYVDETISGILVRAVVDGDIRDSEGEPAATPRYRAKVMKLFARVAATSDGSAGFWRHYAQLLMAEAKREREEEGVNGMKIEPSRITQCLGKCHRKALARDPAWAKDLGKTAELADHCVRLAEEYLEVADIFGGGSAAASVLGSGKLTLNSALVLLKRARDDLALFSGGTEDGKMGELEEMLAKLEGALQTIKGAIEKQGAQV